jgi:hypothetical protein
LVTVLTIESRAWRRAAEKVSEELLPADVWELLHECDRIEAELEELSKPAPAVEASKLVLAGKTSSEAQKEVNAAHEEAERKLNESIALRDALQVAERRVVKWFDAPGRRDALIEGPLRDAVAAVIAEAEPLAAKLKGIKLSSKSVAHRATPAQLSAWRDSEAVSEKLFALRRAWSSSWAQAVRLGSSDRVHLAPLWMPSKLGGVFVWRDPLAVEDADVRDGRKRGALSICRWHDRGQYRLVSPREMNALEGPFENPWVQGERSRRRRSLIPKVDQEPVTARRGVRTAS